MKDTQPEAPATILPQITVASFSETEPVEEVFRDTLNDRRLRRTRWKSGSGGIPGAIEAMRGAPSPSLLVLESQADGETILKQLDALADECHQDTKVIVIVDRSDISLFRALTHNGVHDVLVAPLKVGDVVESMEYLFLNDEKPQLGRVTAFIGARGGVGSSSLAHNVAYKIAGELDTNVLLADVDMQFGTVGLDFDIESNRAMNEIIKNPKRLDDTLIERLAHKYDDNLLIMGAEPGLDENIDPTPSIERLIDLAQTSARHVILDLPVTWNKYVRLALHSADEVVITASPDIKCLRNVRFMAEKARKFRRNDRPPYLVFNKVGVPKRPEIRIDEFCEAVELKAGEQILYDPVGFTRAENEGKVLSEMKGRSQQARQFLEIGKVINGQKSRMPSASKGSIWRRMIGAK